FELGNLGMFNLGLDATYVDSYQYQLTVDRPVVEAVGLQNNLTGAVPPMPEWKGNLNLAWIRGQHSANMTVRYIDSMVFDADPFAFQAALPYSNYRTTTELHESTIVDAAYNFSQYEAL